jgi:hypothetical protein
MLTGILRNTVFILDASVSGSKEITLQEKLIDALKYLVSFGVIMT